MSGTKKIHLAIVMDGGIIQDIVSNVPGFFDDIEITVIDYDIDGAGDDECQTIIQSDESEADAFVSVRGVTLATIQLPIEFI